MSEALGNVVDRALVSEATHRDARGQGDRQSLGAAVDAIRGEVERRNGRKGIIEARLTAIKNEIRAGGRLPNMRYEQLCREQSTLALEAKEIDQLNLDAKQRIRSLEEEMPASDRPNNWASHFGEMVAQLKQINGKLSMILDRLPGA